MRLSGVFGYGYGPCSEASLAVLKKSRVRKTKPRISSFLSSLVFEVFSNELMVVLHSEKVPIHRLYHSSLTEAVSFPSKAWQRGLSTNQLIGSEDDPEPTARDATSSAGAVSYVPSNHDTQPRTLPLARAYCSMSMPYPIMGPNLIIDQPVPNHSVPILTRTASSSPKEADREFI